MILVLLCGGAGTRFNSMFPKPLNLVQGVPMIFHVITKLKNVKKLTIIYSTILDGYGFIEYLINQFNNIDFEFISIDYQTRGAAETLYVGLNKIDTKRRKEQIVVLDNDNIYQDVCFDTLPNGHFLMYNKNPTGLHHYSFVQVNGKYLLDIQERKPITDNICVGGYGFATVESCMEYCRKVILNTHEDEPYLSKVMKSILDEKETIHAVYCSNVYSIGTPKDILLNRYKIEKHKLRVVFDLDNTIVTYPIKYKDYNSVSYIKSTKEFINYLKAQGHEVIIYTARNMVTTNHNIGKALKNIGLTTLEKLKELGIEYDEIHFGKPYGDIYIDDKGFNSYDINLMEKIGFYDFDYRVAENPYKTNKYNNIIRLNNYQIRKTGIDLSGEIYFYTFINHHTILQKYFPKFYTYDDNNSIVIEYINGTSISKIYYEGLFSPELLKKLLDTVYEFHNITITDNIELTEEEIQQHYIHKFEERSKNEKDYPFDDFKEVYQKVKYNLHKFLKRNTPIHSIIHGDLWFSNMMYYKQNFYFYDMRGKIHQTLTIKGHKWYDYGKIYQSIIGLDAIILYNTHIDPMIRQCTENLFWEILYDKGILNDQEDKKQLKQLTGYLIYNTFFAYDDIFEQCKKEKIWELVKECINA